MVVNYFLVIKKVVVNFFNSIEKLNRTLIPGIPTLSNFDAILFVLFSHSVYLASYLSESLVLSSYCEHVNLLEKQFLMNA